jgi:lipid-binding SYLF domain-containing protein
MKTLLRVVLCAVMLASGAFASEAASSRLESAATVLNEIMATPDKGIPSDILGSAKCVAVVPNLLKGGFIVGGAHGRGMATCRTATGWSAPAPITTTGGSIGLQIGGQAVDLVMVVMNDHGMQALLTNKFKLGADASVAAGPVGRHTEGSTDWKLRAEVLTYSRARGLFAGISFNGAVIKQDEDATGELYGRQVDFKTILTGSVQPPQSAEKFLAAVKQAAGTDVAPPNNPVPSTPPSSSRPAAPVNPPAATPSPTPEATPAAEPAPATETTPTPTPTPPPAAANRVDAKFDSSMLS